MSGIKWRQYYRLSAEKGEVTLSFVILWIYHEQSRNLRVTAEMFKSLLAEICHFNTIWLSRKWPPLVHDKVVAYGKNQENKLNLNWLT